MKLIELSGTRKVESVVQTAPGLKHPTDALLKIIRADTCIPDIHYCAEAGIGNQCVHFPYGHECHTIVSDPRSDCCR